MQPTQSKVLSLQPLQKLLSRVCDCSKKTMKQKVVMKVPAIGQKGQSKAMKIVVGVPGVISVAIAGETKNLIVVIGENIDSVLLTNRLRKKVGFTELVSVTTTEEEREEESTWKLEQVWRPQYSVPQHYAYVVPHTNPDPCCIM